MILLKFVLLAILSSLYKCDSNSLTTIKVLLPRIEQFSDYDSRKQIPNKLAEKIINNFAQRFNLNVKYIITNQTLNEVFRNEDHRKHILQS